MHLNMARNGSTQALRLQQRVCELETQLAESLRCHNEELADLQNQLAQLHSRCEQGETVRQQLEYQLTLAQREAAESRNFHEEKEREFKTLQGSLDDRITKLSQQCQDWKSTLETVQQARAQERAEHQHLFSSKEEQLSHLRSQYEELVHTREQVEADLVMEKSTVSELQSKLHCMDKDLNEKQEVILNQIQDLEAANERERKLQNDFQAALHRAKLLGDSLETEKAAHLDSKFSSEITQLRIKELEESLETERTAHERASSALAEAKQRLGTLQSSLEVANQKQLTLQEELRSKELECHSLEQQVRDKQSIVSDLSEQLSVHKRNFDSLKEELTQAQRLQSHVEESYSGCVQQVWSLLEHSGLVGEKSHGYPPDSVAHVSSTSNPSHVVDKLRMVLTGFQTQMESRKSELAASRQEVERLSTECSTYKEVVTTRTSAMAEAEQRLSESARELARTRSELSRCRLQLSSARSELEGAHKDAEREKSQQRETRDQLLSLKKQYSSTNEAHCQFLQLLQEQLQTALTAGSHLTVPLHTSTLHTSTLHTSTPTQLPHTTSWRKLSAIVNTTAASLIEAMRRMCDEIVQLRSTIQTQQSTLDSTEAMHREAIANLTETLERREQEWAQKHLDLHTHYESLLSEVEERAQKYQQCAEEAFQKVEQLTTSKQQVEAHLTRLQEVHQTYKNDRACLLTCASLLAGSLFPALERIQQLIVEKSLLLKQISSHKNLQMKVCELVTLIQADIGDSSPTENGKNGTPHFVSLSEYTYHPLLRFRKLVIVVLAVNRLLRLCAESTMTFSLGGTESRNLNPNLWVCVGTRDGKVPSRKKHGAVRPSPRCSNKDLVGWLRSETMLIEARESFTELQSTLDACTVLHHLHQPRGGRKEKTLPNHTQRRPDLETSAVASTKASFAVLLEKVASHFPFTPHSPPPPPSHITLLTPPGSLWSRLGEGLTVALRAGQPYLTGHTTCSKLGEVLHKQLMGLVGRLHEVELDRQSLHSQLRESKEECEQLSRVCTELQETRQQVEALRSELASTVPGERFEAVCADLQRALQREREAQATLDQQTTTLQQLQTRLQTSAHDLLNKDTALSEALKELNDSHISLHHCNQELRRVGRQLQQAEGERRIQTQHLEETQNALRQAITEKETIQELLQCAEAAFSQSKQKLSEAERSGTEVDFSRLILKAMDEFVLQRPDLGAQLDTCQLMLKSFVDAHQCALTCLATMHDQVASCEEHIAALKVELSAACRRQMAEACTGVPRTFQGQMSSHPTSSPADGFIPLQERLNASSIPMTVEELSPRRLRKTSPADDSLLIAAQGARLGAELAKSLNL